jgi:hypothetical protein
MQGLQIIKSALLSLLLLTASTLADSSMRPTEQIVKSQDASKQVRFVPNGTTNATIIVSNIRGGATNQLWKTHTKHLPNELHVSNNGSSVVTSITGEALATGITFSLSTQRKAKSPITYSNRSSHLRTHRKKTPDLNYPAITVSSHIPHLRAGGTKKCQKL